MTTKRKTNRNLKLFNHWIAEVRDLAIAVRPRLKREVDEGKYETLTKSDIRYLFDKSSMEESFKEDMTPQDALEAELECWEQAVPD